MTFFDGWRALNTCLDASDLTAPTQLVAYKLFAIFNERRFPESLLVSDRELMSRTNLKSTKTIFEARRQLKNAGIFDFAAEPGKTTRYNFGKQLINSSETVGKQLVNSSETPEANPNIHVREDIKTSRQKTLEEEDNACACAPVNCDAKSVEVMDVLDLWEYETGKALHGSVGYELQMLEEQYGRDKIHKAIQAAVAGTRDRYANFNYFKAILKGGDKNARVAQRPVNNRPNVLAFNGSRTAGDSGDIPSSGKGRFDDDEPDYGWLYEGNEGNANA